MRTYRTIKGYCATQKINNYSVLLACINTGVGTYLKGTVNCDYVRNGGNCSNCTIRNNHPEEFR